MLVLLMMGCGRVRCHLHRVKLAEKHFRKSNNREAALRSSGFNEVYSIAYEEISIPERDTFRTY